MKSKVFALIFCSIISCKQNKVVNSYEEAQASGIHQGKKLLVVFDCEKACSGSGRRTRQLLSLDALSKLSNEYIFTYLLTDDQDPTCQDSTYGLVDCDAKKQVDLTRITSQPLICVVDPKTEKAIVFTHWITEIDSLIIFLHRNK